MSRNKDFFWNHRVIFHPEGKYYTIHEVFYKDGKINGYTVDGVVPMGETLEELTEELNRMLRATQKKVLVYTDIADKRPKKAKRLLK